MTYKKWENYTDQELVDLYTGENWDDFFEFQCALKGIPFLPKNPGPEPEKVSDKPDTVSWRVGGIMFQNKKDADEVFALITTKTLVTDEYQNSDIRTVKVINADNYNYPQLKQTTNYSKELYEKIKPEIKAYEERKKNWKILKENYEEVSAQRDELYSDMYETISNQLQLNREYADMQEKYEKYLLLADNNKTIALKFLENSFPKYKETFPEFFVEVKESSVRDS